MLSTPKTNKKAGSAISSLRMSLQNVGGCFGGMCKLPPLTNYLFDEMFRLDELRSGADNPARPVNSPVEPVEKEKTGEQK